MKAFLLGILKIAGLILAFIVINVVAFNAPRVGQGIALLALTLGGVAIFKPLPRIGLGQRWFAALVVLFPGLVSMLFSIGMESAVLKADLQELAKTDPDAYLEQLQRIDEDQWLNELRRLRPDEYQAEIKSRAELAALEAEAADARAEEERMARVAEQELRAQAEKAELEPKVAEILGLIREDKWVIARTMLGRLGEGDLTAAHADIEATALSILKTNPASDLEGSKDRYAFLVRLRPDKLEYREKVEQAELGAKVANILKSIRKGNWATAGIVLRGLVGGDLTTAYDEIEAVALSVVKPLPASDLSGNQEGYAFLSKLRPDNAEYRRKTERYAARIEEAKRSRDRSRAEAERQRLASAPGADAWAKVSGALMGMAAACGYEVSDQWIKAVVRKRRAVALGEADFAASTETFDTYSTRAFFMQSTDPNMSCGQVIDMMRDSEREMR